tara:strand:- start:241 stop:411 length:171 start_codon:yes stop_codon:yes gene_type:complete
MTKVKIALTKIANHYRDYNFFTLSWSQLTRVEKQLNEQLKRIEFAKERMINETTNN